MTGELVGSLFWLAALAVLVYVVLESASRLTLRDLLALAALTVGAIVVGSLYFTGTTDAGLDLLTRAWDALKAAARTFLDEFEKGERGR